MTEDYKRAIAELERKAMVVVDRSDPADWKVTPTALGARIAQRIIDQDPARAEVWRRLGFAVRTGAVSRN